MSKTVEVPFGDNATETAQNLLAAARRLDVPSAEVRTTSKGKFLVPKKVAEEAKAFSEGKGADDKPADTEKPADTALSDLTNKELEVLADSEGITLESADKKNKDSRVAKIEAVRAERTESKE